MSAVIAPPTTVDESTDTTTVTAVDAPPEEVALLAMNCGHTPDEPIARQMWSLACVWQRLDAAV
jgi:hypothetical protein